jgi:glycosyltransferase involved in cell wall biosynthesis
MKIIVAALSAPVHLNGVSRHSANLVRGLLSRAEISEVHLLVGAWQLHTYSDAVARTDPRLHIHSVPISQSRWRRNWWYYSELPRVAAQLDADIVHLAYPMPLSARACHCPTVVSLHDLYPFDIPENFGFPKGLMNRQIVRQCLRSADAIACVSESTRQRLSHWLGRGFADKAITILNSVEPASSVFARGPQSLHKGHPFLLCIAQHRRNKNIPLALQVFDRALRMGAIAPTTQLAIIGVPGPETPRIQAQIRDSRLDRKVVILSGISDSELQWCYRNCELLLAPSLIEGFGLPVVEALLAGCKVVCSDIPAFREIGVDGCRFVALGPGELDTFIGAVHEARCAPRRLPLAMPWLSALRIAEKYIMLYRHLLTCPVDEDFGALRVSLIGSPDGM